MSECEKGPRLVPCDIGSEQYNCFDSCGDAGHYLAIYHPAGGWRRFRFPPKCKYGYRAPAFVYDSNAPDADEDQCAILCCVPIVPAQQSIVVHRNGRMSNENMSVGVDSYLKPFTQADMDILEKLDEDIHETPIPSSLKFDPKLGKREEHYVAVYDEKIEGWHAVCQPSGPNVPTLPCDLVIPRFQPRFSHETASHGDWKYCRCFNKSSIDPEFCL